MEEGSGKMGQESEELLGAQPVVSVTSAEGKGNGRTQEQREILQVRVGDA